MKYSDALSIELYQSHMTQADLARAIGKSTSYVSQLMGGKVQEPRLSMAVKIAEACGTDIQSFVDLMNSDKQ